MWKRALVVSRPSREGGDGSDEDRQREGPEDLYSGHHQDRRLAVCEVTGDLRGGYGQGWMVTAVDTSAQRARVPPFRLDTDNDAAAGAAAAGRQPRTR